MLPAALGILEAARGAEHVRTVKVIQSLIGVYDARDEAEPDAAYDAKAAQWRAKLQGEGTEGRRHEAEGDRGGSPKGRRGKNRRRIRQRSRVQLRQTALPAGRRQIAARERGAQRYTGGCKPRTWSSRRRESPVRNRSPQSGQPQRRTRTATLLPSRRDRFNRSEPSLMSGLWHSGQLR
ncbi:MAG: hypothetical protein V3W34_19550 [Phycisphaerae bacterium]